MAKCCEKGIGHLLDAKMITHIWETKTEKTDTEYGNEIAVQICLLEKTLCELTFSLNPFRGEVNSTV